MHRYCPIARLGLYQFLLAGRDAADLRVFHEEVLGPLLVYDCEHGSELVKTLEGYFNSLLYRLQRIEEMAAVRLNDPETRLLLQLALRVGQVMGLVADARAPLVSR